MESFVTQLAQQQAIEFYKSKVYESWTQDQIATFQLYQERLCMPFSIFHEAIEKTLGRSVWTHEFAYPDNLRRELEGILNTPTMQEILDLLPKDKIVVIYDDTSNG